jgi:hypothetical protein
MANRYIIIQENGTGGLTKWFRAVSWRLVLRNNKTVEPVIDASPDVQHGRQMRFFQYVLKIPYVLRAGENANYGTYADLCNIYSRNSPNSGTPLPSFKFTAHNSADANAVDAIFVNPETVIEPATTIIDTDNAVYFVQVEILVL